MRGYKAFEKDLTCRGFQFEIGKEYEHKGTIKPCESGFHFCESLADCYNFYPMSEDTRICEVCATGDIDTDDNIKFVTNKIKIVREVKNPREKSNKNKTSTGYYNTGDYNTGNRNTGYYNTGDYNTGNLNTGNRNTGYYNTGNRNTGDYNTGDYNTGDYNTGNRNTGDYNTGDYNTGDYNTGNRNTGVFCTNKNPKINMFDAPSEWTTQDWLRSDAREILLGLPYTHTTFVWSSDMSEEEKENHPEYKTIGGYLKAIMATTGDKQAWWDNLTVAEKNIIKALPNFDEVKFCKCIGIERI